LAARRLIAILLVLLFLSSLAAALAPVQETGESVSSSTETSTTDPPTSPTLPGPSGEEPTLIIQSVDTSLERSPLIRAGVGDQLQLKVTSRRTGTVELEDIGPTEDAGPQQPAFFDVLLREPGTYRVRFLETDREIARIKVSAAQP
jgi:hypothetical protein